MVQLGNLEAVVYPDELNRSRVEMVAMNNVAYPIELVCYTIILALVPAYLILSKGACRFHPLLRLQIIVLFVELFFLSLTRGIGVILRLYEAVIIVLPPNIVLFRDYMTNFNYSCVTYVHLTVIVLPFERLLAAIRLKDYEKSFHHPIYKIVFLLYVIIPWTIINYILFFYGGLYNIWANATVLNACNISVTLIYLVAYVVMEISQRLSIKYQKSNVHRELSTSFQYKENLLIISIIRPIFIYLFFSRLFQFLMQCYMWDLGLILGAIVLRIVINAYNVSVAFGFMLVPVFLLKSHPNLIRLTKKPPAITMSDGEAYFRELHTMWS